jgi:hypothetical protein
MSSVERSKFLDIVAAPARAPVAKEKRAAVTGGSK